ncbi:hypothetical protein BB560_003811 [Smittium megazygosporum]|uniref:HMG box domain-containing protein n=1 Tax=Smittium megazygosporum TaxID=133381 RepID=A0A2T9ZB28_9FUNG|nr:hypothetical protein BB560_003811 [Smittium megazygosporum]
MSYLNKAKQANLERQLYAKQWWDNVDKSKIELENERRRRINAIKKSQGKRLDKLLKNPFEKRRCLYPFGIFVKDMYSKKVVSGNVKQSMRILSKIWKDLPVKEKEVYYDLAKS